MSPTLNLFDRLLDTACRLHQAGRTNDAFAYLCKLTALRDLPAPVAVAAHLRMAELLLKRGKPTRGRRHLTVALRHEPDNARAHRLMAEAQDGGRLPDPFAALEHARRCVELAPEVESLCFAGELAVRQGLSEEGLGYLRKAAELGGDDPEVLKKVTDGMLLANRADEARGLLRATMFRHSRDRRFRALWDRFQFRQLRKEQGEELARRAGDSEDGPVLLPFTAEGAAPRRRVRAVRLDGPATLPGPHPAVFARPRLAR